MSKRRDWFWQIEALGQGPDYVFVATFDPSDAPRLAAAVSNHLPPGFVASREFFDAQERAQYSIFETYVDEHTYSRFVDNQKRSQPESIWYYGEIAVHDHQLIIEHNNSQGMYDDTGLIMALATSPELTLQEWTVAYNGYTYGAVAAGTDAASLLTYLQCEA